MIADSLHGLTLTELVIAVGAVGYVVSLARDWRPVKSLRAENRDLRQMLELAEKKIATLETQVETLQKATDLTALVDEHKRIADVLDRVVKKLEALDGAVKGNTAAIETVARGTVLRQTLKDMKEKDE